MTENNKITKHSQKTQRDLWKICNKIREVVNRIKFNFWEYYSNYDIKNIGYVSVFVFKNVLAGPFKTTINLNDEEIQLLVKYFENSNHQVRYGEFCQMIHNEIDLNKKSSEIKIDAKDFEYTIHDLPRLKIMKKIVNDLDTFHISLEPYFKDYEELTGNNGLMTTKQFTDMLYALKIRVLPLEMQLIINKFITYSYMIDKKQFLDELSWVRINDPQHLFTTDANNEDKSKENNARLFSNNDVFHPMIANRTKKHDNVITILRNIKKHVSEKRINIEQFFEPFDPQRKGYVTEEQFRRCLDMMAVGSLYNLYYSESELSLLLLMYKDKVFPERVKWKNFVDEINTVFAEKKMKKTSNVEIKCERNANEMLRIRGQDWEAVELNLRKFFNVTMINIKNYLNRRSIMLEQFLKDFDKNNHGHISRSSFRRAMLTAGVKCSEDELGIIEKRFLNVDGFNYYEFLKMLTDIDKKIKQCSKRNNVNFNVDNDENTLASSEKISCTTLADLMVQIKTTVKRKRIRIDQFLKEFDTLNHQVVSNNNFQRGLSMAGIHVDSNEFELLTDEFESKTCAGHVEYRRFCDAAEEAFVTLRLERTPSAYPKEYLTTYEGTNNCLTHEERTAVDSALTKLCSKPDIGLDELFKDHDKTRQGIVSMREFLGVLTVRKLNMLLSLYEIQCLKKAFSDDDSQNDFNYRAFIKTIEYSKYA